MKNFGIISLFVCIFAAAGFAQSGRKIVVELTPATTENKPFNPTTTPNNDQPFSDSQPITKKSLDPTPNFHGVSETKRTPNIAPANSSKPVNLETSSDEGEILKVETNLITIPVSVFDRNGLYIPNLKKENFKVFENGKEEEVAYFGTSEKPFTVVLLLDTSPSTEYKIEEIQNAARSFVDRLKPQDSVMVIEFAGNVHVLTEPTSDREKIYKAIRKADFGEGTSLYDAVDFSIRKRLDKIAGRKAIVLFTDGVDTTSSKIDYDGTLGEAEEADALIFPIYYNTYSQNPRNSAINSPFPAGGGRRGTSSGEYALGKKYLEDLAAYTGGRVFTADSSITGLEDAFTGIADELRRQYNIGYYPSDSGQTGQRKQIKVRVDRPNLIVRSRDSYIVGATSPDSPKTK